MEMAFRHEIFVAYLTRISNARTKSKIAGMLRRAHFVKFIYERILAAYDEASPLADGWRERIALHQAHIMMIHCAVFGRAYVPDAVRIARRYA